MIPDTAESDRIESRSGVDVAADYILSDSNYEEILCREVLQGVHCVLIDEAQFLSTAMVEQLRRLVNELDVEIVCYGLKTSFKRTLFAGSRRLMELSDVIEEIRSVCGKCIRPAIFSQNMRGTVLDGVIMIGHDIFEQRCARCFRS